MDKNRHSNIGLRCTLGHQGMSVYFFKEKSLGVNQTGLQRYFINSLMEGPPDFLPQGTKFVSMSFKNCCSLGVV